MSDTRERTRDSVRGEGCKCAPDHLTAFASSEAALARKQERLECAKAVCSYCRSPHARPAEYNEQYSGWFHMEKSAMNREMAERTMSRCDAAKIHERNLAETGG